MALLKEFCAENMEHVPAAIDAGAGRIELCDNLAVGGTSPSYGVIRAAVSYADEHGVAIMAMARPRGGNFVYTEIEAQMLLDDIAVARGLGVTGVVFGCVRRAENGSAAIDANLTSQLVEAAKGPRARTGGCAGAPVQVTFHMAFDVLDEEHQLQAIDILSRLGVERILTHGGAAGTPIADNLSHLRHLISYANGRVRILPGGGITWQNAEGIAKALYTEEVHGTKIVKI
ncbi:MAG: copper homeostasis protein CutC [Olsenella sp.]|jgi:copper homeostasis protein|nr:copper homeostasis protein CutC [Olsenella sp.]MCI1645025.1 copper homeostasis protein CutC [Olsenella sp.]MCI1792858.1 copper homeostasis protein CutC [Olsenella sp.]MCI1810647.1 copper homeostasis protein CutC [Olsenella sp.]MCI2123675.1 copper homeostasis protein CutC [Olsenella sp.]